MPTSFKITFNKPAYRTFFEGEDMAGLKINVEKNSVFFRPVNTVTGDDVVPIAERTRGGVEVTIEGTMADTLLKLLRPRADNPFFLLRRAGKNWMEAVEYTGKSYEPPKYEPHARVWHKDARGAVRVAEPISFAQVMEDVRAAKALVDSHDADRRSGGRPPREVNEARAVLALFAETAREVLPFQALNEAHGLLGRFLGLDEAASKAQPAAMTHEGAAEPGPTADETAAPHEPAAAEPEAASPETAATPAPEAAEPEAPTAPEPAVTHEPAPVRKPARSARKAAPEPAPEPQAAADAPAPAVTEPAQADFLRKAEPETPAPQAERPGIHRKQRTLRSRKQEFVVRGSGRRRVLEAV